MESIRKRIALFVGQADEFYQTRFLTGFHQRAFELDMDVCVFAMYKKYQDTAEREKAESNIFNLANLACFEGIVIMKDTIQTADAAEKLEKRIRDQYNGPVLVIDKESEWFPSIYIGSAQAMEDLTEHLVSVHGLRDIAFLTGKKKHRHSKERQEAFLRVMQRHGIEVPKERIIEGDFWYKSGEQCADYLLAEDKTLPEAVMCANDQMAIGLCKALTEKGIRVPEDIVVVGADSSPEGQNSPKSITSYLSPAGEFGRYAMDCLMDLRDSRPFKEFEGKAELLWGESSGCVHPNMPVFQTKREQWGTEISEEGYGSIYNTMFENLLIQKDVTDYVSMVYSYAYQLKGADSVHLCLVNGMGHLEQDFELPGHDGYPKKMIYAMRYNSSHMSNMVGFEEEFDTRDMLPDLFEKRTAPTVYYFNPLYFEEKCFGYAVIAYCDQPKVYDEVYRRWLGTISRGMESLRRQLVLDAMKEQLSKLKTNKFAKSGLGYESLTQNEKEDYELVRAILDQNLLKYHFQPIVSAVDGSIYSYEALMRADTEKKISPLTIIKYAGMMDRLADIESATFCNVLNIVEQEKGIIGEKKIFINSIPGIQIDNYEELEKRLAQNSKTVVVELTEEAQLSDDKLDELKEFFQKVEIEIAVDDYGTGYSNVSNLLRYMPDYVKIDRSLLSEIQNKPQKQHFVREIVNFCHDNGIKALAEGVETSEELRMVIGLGADLIQGYYTARPAGEIIARIDDKIVGEIKTYYQEKSDGKEKAIYVAGKTNRVYLLTLVKEGYTDIVIGDEGMVYNDITIIGMPAMKTDLHLRVEAGYSGRITLENVTFSNVKNRPCIELGEMSEVVLVVEGDNVLHGSGIMVPESARFALEGNGNLEIELVHDNQEYYGIGGDASSRHGELSFQQDGRISIIGNGTTGVGIGSGLGGEIRIFRGAYRLRINGVSCVGIGALHAGCDVAIENCVIEEEISVSQGVGIGSLSEDALISIERSSYQINGDAKEIVCLGTIQGKKVTVEIKDAHAEFMTRADHSTCIGALYGASDVKVEVASVAIESAGRKALAFGGYSEDTHVKLLSVDTKVDLQNSILKDSYAKGEDFIIENGRCKIQVNNKMVEREIAYHFNEV